MSRAKRAKTGDSDVEVLDDDGDVAVFVGGGEKEWSCAVCTCMYYARAYDPLPKYEPLMTP